MTSGPVSARSVDAPGPPATLETLSQYLNDQDAASADFWDEFGTSQSPFFNLTASGTNAKNGVIHYNVTGFSGISGAGTDTDGISAARADLIRHALNVYEDILGINFVETTSTDPSIVDLFFQDNVYTSSGGERAFANNQQGADGSISYAWVNITAGWDSGNSAIGTYAFQTALHEIGHTLGLGHQGLYNAGSGTPTYNNAYWQNDTWQQTMMSYWSQNNYNSQSYAVLIGPMAVDWLTLDRLYGSQGYGIQNGTTTGNTTWCFNSTWVDWTPTASGPLFGYSNSAYAAMAAMLDTNAVCIVDGGGIDTLDLSGFSNNTVIDVSEALASSTIGSISSVAGLTGNLTIAVGTIIENVIGGSGFELIIGNSANNLLDGGGGNDTMQGGAGNDTYRYATGDIIIEAAGGGYDTVNSWNSYTAGANIERVLLMGTANTQAIGNAWNNTLLGNVGNNLLDGGGGNDIMQGGAGNDTYRYATGDTIIEAANGGYDTVNSWNSYTAGANIERVLLLGTAGTQANGNALNNVLIGNSGANILNGQHGSDTLTGGGGPDQFFFANTPNATNIDTITDFTHLVDRIRLENAVFTSLSATGPLNPEWLRVGTVALENNDYLVYNQANGNLFYDADGSGAGAAVLFARLGTSVHPTLSYHDFVVV